MSRVFDCCIIHTELDMLELRLNILRDVVDYFVIVEAGETHSGQPKDRIVGSALATDPRFAPFADKIIYDFVPHLEGDHSWARERFHRGWISTILRDVAAPDDWVIVADVDEIPNPEHVRELQTNAVVSRYPAAQFELEMFYYDFRHYVRQGWGIGACHWTLEQNANHIRTCTLTVPPMNFRSGGWHLSYFMTPDQVVEKLNSFMHHADVAKDVPRDPAWIAARMTKGEDLFGRTVEIVEVDPEPYLPDYVRQNRAKYEALGWLKAETVHAP